MDAIVLWCRTLDKKSIVFERIFPNPLPDELLDLIDTCLFLELAELGERASRLDGRHVEKCEVVNCSDKWQLCYKADESRK